MFKKLTDEVLEEGRELIRKMDLPGLEAWFKKHNPAIDAKVALSTFEKCFLAQDVEKVLKMFEVSIANIEPPTLREIIPPLVIPVLIVAGAIGGIVYLVRTLLGH